MKNLLLLLLLISSPVFAQDLSTDFLPGHENFLKYCKKQYQVSSFDSSGANNDRINILAHTSAEVLKVSNPGLLTRIWITVDSRDPHVLRRLSIRIYWDGETNPSVNAPVGDFFGSPEYKHHISKYIGMSSGGFYSYFPMPFKKSARVEFINESDKEVRLYYHFNLYDVHKLPENLPYFHAYWKRNVRTTPYDSNMVPLYAEGEGYFFGLHFVGQPHDKSLTYLEGDEMIFVDGEDFPSIYGTGWEDYFSSGWYFKDGEYDAPYHGLIHLNREDGRVTAYRHHIPDPIPFNKSLKFTFEVGHNNESTADISTTAIWYQTEPHLALPELPHVGQRTPLIRLTPPEAISMVDKRVKADKSLNPKIEDMTSVAPDYMDAKQLVLGGEKSRSGKIEISDRIEKAYNIKLYPTVGPNFGEATIVAGEHSVTFNAKADQLSVSQEPLLFENVASENGKITLSLNTTGTFGTDAILMEPVREFITDWYLIGPFDNPRLSDKKRLGLDIIYAPENEINLTKKYTGVNGQSISWFKYNEGKAGHDMNMWELFNPHEFVIVYALTYIYSPDERDAEMFIGSDDGIKIFLNDQQCHRFLDVSLGAPDRDQITVKLKKGWNKLLVKAENNFGGYAYYIRIIDLHNELIISSEKKK